MPERDYPPEMLRGVKREEWARDSPPYLSAFFFDDDGHRGDGYRELSVVWYFNDDSLQSLKSIMYDRKPVFKGGVAVVRRDKIDEMSKKHGFPVKYEFRPSSRMPDHGNILIKGKNSIMERRAAAYIARSAVYYSLDSEILCSNDCITS